MLARWARTFGATFCPSLDDPGLALLTEAARDLGFFFCGMGPAFSEGRDPALLSEPE